MWQNTVKGGSGGYKSFHQHYASQPTGDVYTVGFEPKFFLLEAKSRGGSATLFNLIYDSEVDPNTARSILPSGEYAWAKGTNFAVDSNGFSIINGTTLADIDVYAFG